LSTIRLRRKSDWFSVSDSPIDASVSTGCFKYRRVGSLGFWGLGSNPLLRVGSLRLSQGLADAKALARSSLFEKEE
jgi:hypothetical protein